MTVLQAISATVATCIFGIFVMTVIFLRLLRQTAEAQFERGWCEGWDDRDNDRYPDSPEPKGRHHMTAEEAETAITQFLIDSGVEAEPTVLINCKTSYDPDNPSVLALPKRKPAGYTQNRQKETS